jgi:hypothetical protein
MDNNEKSLQEKLDTVINYKRRTPIARMTSEIMEICHNLAESRYQPALEFFLEGLNDSNWSWRQRCLQMIGYHYVIPPGSEITEQVRKMLIFDPDVNVRETAANVLSVISALPDNALVKALSSDPDQFVRGEAYYALLRLAGAPYQVYVRERERYESGEMLPTIQDVKRILAEEGIEVPANTFGIEDPDE